MRKFALLLALTLCLYTAGCASKGNAAATPQASSSTKSTVSESKSAESSKPAEQSSKTESLLSKSYADMMKNGKFLIRYKSTFTNEAGTMEAEITNATNGSASSNIIKAKGISNHVIIKDNVIYMLNDTNKTYSKMDASANGQSAQTDILEAGDITYVGNGTATVNGKSLPYEEYKVSDGKIRFFFEGTKLYAMVNVSPDGEMVMVILEMTDKVPADTFTIPADYKESSQMMSTPGGVGMTEEQIKELQDLQKQIK